MCMASTYVYNYAKQKHPGCKKCEAKKQHYKCVHMQPKALISTKAKKLFIKNPLCCLNSLWCSNVFNFSQL